MHIPRPKTLLQKLTACRLDPLRLIAVLLMLIILLTGIFFFKNPLGHPATALQDSTAATQAVPTTPTPAPAAPDTPAEGAVIPHSLPREAAQLTVMLTAHFARHEFQCDCTDACDGFPVEMDNTFMAKLEALRLALGRPVIVTSGVRCPVRNAEVGGIAASWHLTGRAADIYCPGIPYSQVGQAARDLGFGVIEYPAQQYCHVEY